MRRARKRAHARIEPGCQPPSAASAEPASEEPSFDEPSPDEASVEASGEAESEIPVSCAPASDASAEPASCPAVPLLDPVEASGDGGATALSSPLHAASNAYDASASG
jgi:hypothetical protein